MTVTAFLSVSPATDESMAPAVARAIDALETFDVEYETTPMGTVVETDDIGELFAAAQAAHEAVDADRNSTDRPRADTTADGRSCRARQSVPRLS
jgi:uncharacterized protein YqgV (UPF0045/DUF77 family)